MLLSELHARVAIEVPGAPQFAVEGVVNEAASDFCRRARAWRIPFGPVPFYHWQSTYKVTLPPDTILVEPTEVRIDDRLQRTEYYWTAGIDQIELAENQFAGNVLTGEVAVTLTPSGIEVPDQVGYEFSDVIVTGALGRLMRIPNAEWSNPQQMMLYMASFEEGIDRATTRVANGFKQNRTRRVRYGGY